MKRYPITPESTLFSLHCHHDRRNVLSIGVSSDFRDNPADNRVGSSNNPRRGITLEEAAKKLLEYQNTAK